VLLPALIALGVGRSKDAFLLASWICFALLPAMMGQGGSYARHALLSWLCFVLTVGPATKPPLKWAFVVPGFALQLYLAYCFGANRSVA